MKVKTFFASAAVLVAGTVFAAELYRPGFEDFIPPKRVGKKDGFYSVSGERFWVQGRKAFAVDPAKKYTVSGEFRFRGTPLKSFYVGLTPLTAKEKPIPPAGIHAEPGTETALAAPAAVGDTTLKVADAQKWNNKFPYPAVVFNAKDNFADFPNYDHVSMKKGSVKKRATSGRSNWRRR